MHSDLWLVSVYIVNVHALVYCKTVATAAIGSDVLITDGRTTFKMSDQFQLCMVGHLGLSTFNSYFALCLAVRLIVMTQIMNIPRFMAQ